MNNSTLITGFSGFLGRVLHEYCIKNNLSVVTLGRNNGTYEVDLSQNVPAFNQEFNTVIHCAGKAHSIPKSAAEKQAFFDVNFKGTQNLLQALSLNIPQHFIFISTVAVYGCETGKLISEEHSLDGNSAYAASKFAAEVLVRSWGKKHQVPVLILRLPLIAGPNPPGNLGKMIAGIQTGRYLSIAGGKARRSVVLAEDVANLIFDNFKKEGTYNLSDGHHPTFREIEACIAGQLNKPMPKVISTYFAKLMGRVGNIIPGSPVNSATVHKMINDLTFDDSKARGELQWEPRRVIDHFKIA